MSIDSTTPLDIINTVDKNNSLDANSTIDMNNTINTTSISTYNYARFTSISDILNCVHVVISIFAVVIGSFIVNIVRKLDDDQLRSRFSLLAVLISDVVLSVSNFTEIGSLFSLILGRRITSVVCPLIYVNTILTLLFSTSLVMSLLCLAFDQVVAVFSPLYFHTNNGKRRRVVFSVLIITPVPLVLLCVVINIVSKAKDVSNVIYCDYLLKTTLEVSLYILSAILVVVFITLVVYAVVLCKISLHRRVQAESVKNRKLVVSFFFLSASYFLFWIPILLYFGACFIKDTCWQSATLDLSIIMHIIFTLNYIVDPIICAIRMEPINQRIRQMFSSHQRGCDSHRIR